MRIILKVPVRLGYPDNIQGLPPEYRYPQYANVLGAIQCGGKNLDISYQENPGHIPKCWTEYPIISKIYLVEGRGGFQMPLEF